MKNTDFISRGKKTLAGFGGYVAEHWLTLTVLAVSATQTFALFYALAPQYFWLAGLAVCVLEGGFLYWRWREYNADIADGNLADVEKNAQEIIANRMVYVCLALSVLTMLAGAGVEMTKSDLENFITRPEILSTMGLLAIGGVFVICGLHLYNDWQYRRADPMAVIERDHRQTKRHAEAEGRRKVLVARNAHLQSMYNANSDSLGRNTAAKDFGRLTKQYAAETETVKGNFTNGEN